MLKKVKKLLLISLILLIQSLIITYKFISKFWKKYNSNIKNFVKNLDKELRMQI